LRIKEVPGMRQFTKTIHVLAVGLWFGASVFFSFPVALSLIQTFETEGKKPGSDRPPWFPLPARYNQDPATWNVPDSEPPLFQSAEDVRKEQGVRAFGVAVGPVFGWYFLLQGICGFLALGTALPWSRAEPGVKAHRLRVLVLLLALVTVLAGWPLEKFVSGLRGPRNEATDALLKAAPDVPKSVYDEAVASRRAFGTWHAVGLFLNFGTIALVTVGMALTARLPNRPAKPCG
jgi:hypothetical protein